MITEFFRPFDINKIGTGSISITLEMTDTIRCINRRTKRYFVDIRPEINKLPIIRKCMALLKNAHEFILYHYIVFKD